MRENLAVALICFASVVEYDIVHLENFAKKTLRGCGAVSVAQTLVFCGKAWLCEQSAANHYPGEFGVASFHFANLRDACDVAVIYKWMRTFVVESFESVEVDCPFVLLFAESRMNGDVGEGRFV